MTDATLPTIRLRYVAGFGMAHDDGSISGSVFLLAEDEDGNRVGGPTTVIGELNPEQAQHLHMQLGNLLRIMGVPPLPQLAEPAPPGRIETPLQAWVDLTPLEPAVQDQIGGPGMMLRLGMLEAQDTRYAEVALSMENVAALARKAGS